MLCLFGFRCFLFRSHYDYRSGPDYNGTDNQCSTEYSDDLLAEPFLFLFSYCFQPRRIVGLHLLNVFRKRYDADLFRNLVFSDRSVNTERLERLVNLLHRKTCIRFHIDLVDILPDLIQLADYDSRVLPTGHFYVCIVVGKHDK